MASPVQQWQTFHRHGALYSNALAGASTQITPWAWTALLTHRCHKPSTTNLSFSLVVNGTNKLLFGGQGTWNQGTAPPSIHIFFSSQPRYNLRRADTHEDDYWWSSATVPVTTTNISASLTADNWQNAHGHRNPTGFANAVTHMQAVGISFGGGSFFDVGVRTIHGQTKVTITEP